MSIIASILEEEAYHCLDCIEAENVEAWTIRVAGRIEQEASQGLAAVQAERDRLQAVVNQGAAGALCPDLRTHGERVHRIVAAAEAAESERDALRERVEALADEWKWYEAGDITAALRAALGGDE